MTENPPQTPSSEASLDHPAEIQAAGPDLQKKLVESLAEHSHSQTFVKKFHAVIKLLQEKLQSFFQKKSQDSPLGDNNIHQEEEIHFKIAEKKGLRSLYFFLLSKKDMLLFLEQLSTLLSSGIRLVDSLVIIKQQSSSKAFHILMEEIVAKVRSGQLLSQALSAYPKLFPVKWVSLIHTGEKSGELEKILTDLYEEEEKQQKLISDLKGAMAYPVFVLLLTFGLLLYMLLVVVPQISEIYQKMHQSLPAPTQFVIAASEFIQSYIFFIILIFVIFIIAIHISSHFFRVVREILDALRLRIPVLGTLKQKQNIAIFSGNMALLLQSGVLVVDALQITQEVMPSPLYKKELGRILQGVTTGKKISQEMGLINLQQEQFKKNFYFPLTVSQMIHIGEETGNLGTILNKMKRNYTNQIGLTIKTFSSLLEPFMIIFVGLIVGAILLAVILPFFSMKV